MWIFIGDFKVFAIFNKKLYFLKIRYIFYAQLLVSDLLIYQILYKDIILNIDIKCLSIIKINCRIVFAIQLHAQY